MFDTDNREERKSHVKLKVILFLITSPPLTEPLMTDFNFIPESSLPYQGVITTNESGPTDTNNSCNYSYHHRPVGVVTL